MPRRKKAQQPRLRARWKKLYHELSAVREREAKATVEYTASAAVLDDLAARILFLIRSDIESMIEERIEGMEITVNA